MRTIIINGSMSKKGNTQVLIDELRKNLIHKSEVINICDYNVQPCTNCKSCWRFFDCCIKDDAHLIYNKVMSADAVVLASPIYFSHLTGPMINFISRSEPIYINNIKKPFGKTHKPYLLKEKIGGIILTSGGKTVDCCQIKSTMLEYFNVMNINLVGSIGSLNTHEISARLDIDALKRTAQVARTINIILNKI